MKGKIKYLLFVLVATLFVTSCQQDVDVVEEKLMDNQALLKSGHVDDWTTMTDPDWAYAMNDVSFEVCEEGMTWPFFESAMVTVSNDEDCIYVTVNASEGFLVKRLSFNAWPVGSPDINYDYDNFPYQKWFHVDQSDKVVFKVCDQWDTECLVFNIKVWVQSDTRNDYWWVTTDNRRNYTYSNVYVEYCLKECECLPYRTQTPGGWGAPARGNNPGAYRDVNFADAFPDGLVVGGDNTLSLTSAEAVKHFLPSGGRPQALRRDYVDPTRRLRNVFAGHVVALTLNVGFDAYDENFSKTRKNLGDLVFMDGTGFDGMTVQDVLDEANVVLGGGSSSYSLGELHSIISMVNEYFVGGKWTGDGSLFDDCYDYRDCHDHKRKFKKRKFDKHKYYRYKYDDDDKDDKDDDDDDDDDD